VDVRFDDWHSEKIRTYAGQLFWANAFYVNKSVLSSSVTDDQRERDSVLFSVMGMPDVLGDQATWSDLTTSLASKYLAHADSLSEPIRALEKAKLQNQSLEVMVQQADALANDYLTAPFRRLMSLLKR
jgi:hypothetical protein